MLAGVLLGPRERVLLRCMSKTYAGEMEETSLIKIQGPAASVRFLGIQGSGYPSKVKEKLPHLAPPTTKRTEICFLSLFSYAIYLFLIEG